MAEVGKCSLWPSSIISSCRSYTHVVVIRIIGYDWRCLHVGQQVGAQRSYIFLPLGTKRSVMFALSPHSVGVHLGNMLIFCFGNIICICHCIERVRLPCAFCTRLECAVECVICIPYRFCQKATFATILTLRARYIQAQALPCIWACLYILRVLSTSYKLAVGH